MKRKEIEQKAKEIANQIEKELTDVANVYALDYDCREFYIDYDGFCDGANWVLSKLKEGGGK
ncbi:MAG: hypothetical protein II364_05585 [Bacteroidales bacterium]|nr:hypothetical protein [Bacteroidales bacterium]MBR0335101.1 hypothetical protein [Bacteroidales bacterium]